MKVSSIFLAAIIISALAGQAADAKNHHGWGGRNGNSGCSGNRWNNGRHNGWKHQKQWRRNMNNCGGNWNISWKNSWKDNWNNNWNNCGGNWNNQGNWNNGGNGNGNRSWNRNWNHNWIGNLNANFNGNMNRGPNNGWGNNSNYFYDQNFGNRRFNQNRLAAILNNF